MKNHQFTEDQIDLYIKGKADKDLAIQIEQATLADSEFKREIDFYHQSVEGIKAYRIQQLKTGLANLPTPSLKPWYAQSAGLVAIASISGAILVTSAVLWLQNTSRETFSASKKAMHPEIVQQETGPEIPNQTLPEISPETANSEASVKKQIPKDRKLKSEPQNKNQTTESRKALSVPSDQETNPEVSGDETLATELTPSYDEVYVDKSGLYSFHYQLNSGVLTLYLKDQSSPYEVLDLKKGENQGLYLYYLGRYYGLNPTSEHVVSLKPVVKKALVQELDQFRKGK